MKFSKNGILLPSEISAPIFVRFQWKINHKNTAPWQICSFSCRNFYRQQNLLFQKVCLSKMPSAPGSSLENSKLFLSSVNENRSFEFCPFQMTIFVKIGYFHDFDEFQVQGYWDLSDDFCLRRNFKTKINGTENLLCFFHTQNSARSFGQKGPFCPKRGQKWPSALKRKCWCKCTAFYPVYLFRR